MCRWWRTTMRVAERLARRKGCIVEVLLPSKHESNEISWLYASSRKWVIYRHIGVSVMVWHHQAAGDEDAPWSLHLLRRPTAPLGTREQCRLP